MQTGATNTYFGGKNINVWFGNDGARGDPAWDLKTAGSGDRLRGWHRGGASKWNFQLIIDGVQLVYSDTSDAYTINQEILMQITINPTTGAWTFKVKRDGSLMAKTSGTVDMSGINLKTMVLTNTRAELSSTSHSYTLQTYTKPNWYNQNDLYTGNGTNNHSNSLKGVKYEVEGQFVKKVGLSPYSRKPNGVS